MIAVPRRSEYRDHPRGGGTTISSITPTGSQFSDYVSAPFTATATTNTITLKGTATTDQTAFVDGVRLLTTTAVPWPGGGFEAPAIPAGTFQYGPPITGWNVQPTLSHGNAGLASNGSAFEVLAAEGTQVALLQRESTLTTSGGRPGWLAPGGVYIVSVYLSNRTGYGQQVLRFGIDGNPIAVIAPTNEFVRYTFLLVVPPGIGGQLEVLSTVAGTDTTAFVDDVTAQRAG